MKEKIKQIMIALLQDEKKDESLKYSDGVLDMYNEVIKIKKENNVEFNAVGFLSEGYKGGNGYAS